MLNPYIAGSPVVEASMFFGREDVFGWIERSLEGKFVNHILVLHGQRRVGKTSVLKQIPNFLPDKYIQVFFDLQGRTGTTLERFLWWLASEITRTLKREHGINFPKPDRKDFEDTEYLINGFLPDIRTELGDHVLLLTFDEFDSLDRPEIQETLSHPLIAYLRRLIEVEGLNFIFSIGSSGDKLENMQASYTDFFKSALYRKISFLTKDDIQRLVTKPVEGLIQYEQEAVRRIGEITSGHPYFTQLMCHELFSRCQKTGARTISAEDVEAVLEDVVERGTVNLKFVWDEASDLEKWILATLAQTDGGSNQELAQALTEQHVRFSEPDLNSATLHLRDKDILRDDNRFVIHLMRLWLVANRPIERVREELEEVNPIANRFIEIGDEYRDRGEIQQAIAYYQQALNMNPGDLKAQNNIASVYLEQKDYEKAIQAFESALKIDDEDVVAKTGYCEANLALGEQAQGRKEYEDAIHYYRQALEINPNHVEAKEQSTKLRKLVNDYKEAQQAIREKRYERAVELLQGIIVIDPTYKATTRLLTEAVEARKTIPFWQRRWLLPVAGILALVVLSGFFGPQAWNAFSTVFQAFPLGEGTTAPIDEETLPEVVTDASPTFTEPIAVISPTPKFPVFQIALDYIENEAPTYQTSFDTWDFGDPIENASLESGKLLLSDARISLDQFNFSSDRFAVEFELRLLEGNVYSDCFFESDNGQRGDLKKSMLARYYHGGLGQTFLQTWGHGKSESGRSFNFSETKTATVIVVGDQIASLVDGQLAVTTLHTDGSIVYTQQYLGARSITCEFDNFKFWNLEDAATINTPTPESPAAFYEPIQAYIESQSPTFEDDFETKNDLWGTTSEDIAIATLVDSGELNIFDNVELSEDNSSTNDRSGLGVTFPTNGLLSAKDFAIKFDFHMEYAGGSEADFGVVFRSKPFTHSSADNSGYTIKFFSTGKWELIQNEDETLIATGSFGQKNMQFSGRVLLIVREQNLAVYMNEILLYDDSVLSVSETSITNGFIVEGAAVKFRFVEFWNLEGVEFSTTMTTTPTPAWMKDHLEPIYAYISSQSATFEDDFLSPKKEWGDSSEGIPIHSLIWDGFLYLGDRIDADYEGELYSPDYKISGVTFPTTELFDASDFALQFNFAFNDLDTLSLQLRSSQTQNVGYKISFSRDGTWNLIRLADGTLVSEGKESFVKCTAPKNQQAAESQSGYNAFSPGYCKWLFIVHGSKLSIVLNDEMIYDGGDFVSSGQSNKISIYSSYDGARGKFDDFQFWNLDGVVS